MTPEPIVESSGNVFTDLGFPPDEAAILALRAELMARLRETLIARSARRSEEGNAASTIVHTIQ